MAAACMIVEDALAMLPELARASGDRRLWVLAELEMRLHRAPATAQIVALRAEIRRVAEVPS